VSRLALRLKVKKTPKFTTRAYNRCPNCGRSALPILRPASQPHDCECGHDVQLVLGDYERAPASAAKAVIFSVLFSHDDYPQEPSPGRAVAQIAGDRCVDKPAFIERLETIFRIRP